MANPMPTLQTAINRASRLSFDFFVEIVNDLN